MFPFQESNFRAAQDFDPLFFHPDLQTIAARFWPSRIDLRRFPVQHRLFRTDRDVQVLAHCHFHSAPKSTDTILIIHGLEGSSSSPYVVRMASCALRAGFHVVRMNVRNCGGTEHLGNTLYHSGLTTDLRAIIEELEGSAIYVVGFSMGGNIALKLLGEWGNRVPTKVKAVCAVSPPIDLKASALRLAQRRNRLYERRFIRSLRQTLARKQASMPVKYNLSAFASIKSLVDFDDAYTAPEFGFRNAFEYYEQSSSKNCLDRICVPTLVIQAKDDPFIPFEMFAHPAFQENRNLTLLAPDCGGHVAFISRKPPRFWAHAQATQFFLEIRQMDMNRM